MEHHEIEEQLTGYLLGDLSPEQTEAVRRHLDECDDCRALAKELEPTLDLLRGALAVDAGVPERLDDDRKEEIFNPRHVPETVIWLTQHRSWLMRAAGVAALILVLAALMMPVSKNALQTAQEMPDERSVNREMEPRVAPAKPPETPGSSTADFMVSDFASESESMDNFEEQVVTESFARKDPLIQAGETLRGTASANETKAENRAKPNDVQALSRIPVGGSLALPESEPALEPEVTRLSAELSEVQAQRVAGRRAMPAAKPARPAGQSGSDSGAFHYDPIASVDPRPVDEVVNGKMLHSLEAAGSGIVEDHRERRGDDPMEDSDSATVSGQTTGLGSQGLKGASESARTLNYVSEGIVATTGPATAEPESKSRYVVDADTDGSEMYWGRDGEAEQDKRVSPAQSKAFLFKVEAEELGDKSSEKRSGMRRQVRLESVDAKQKADKLGRELREKETTWRDGWKQAETAATREKSSSQVTERIRDRWDVPTPSAPEPDLAEVEDVTARAVRPVKLLAAGERIEADMEEASLERFRDNEMGLGKKLEGAERDLPQLHDLTVAKLASPAEGKDLNKEVNGRLGEVRDGEFAIVDAISLDDDLPAVVPDVGMEEAEPELVARAYGVNPFVSVAEQAFSTFAIDVDTAAYTLMRKHIQHGVLPPAEAVRTEEFVNFFDYDYRAPDRQTFAVHTSLAPTPFGDGRLLKIGVKGKRLGREEQRPAVLTFVIDTSGSMDTPDRLGLVRGSLDLLIDELGEADRVAIVQVDSRARLILPPTTVTERDSIEAAIQGLQSSGSTHLEEGVKLGYEVAAKAFVGGSVNRVLLLSDGAANLGSANADQILSMVESHRSQGIFCSVFGFGIGAYNDEILEQLANKGDGAYRFIDSKEEARRVFVDELAATLHVIASDVKIQVEFFPEQVQTYRQLGYENRQLTREQFRDDTVDAGEVGSGESVTALYELVPGAHTDQPLGVVRVRYRDVATGEVEEIAHPIRMSNAVASFEEADPRFRLAAAVAEFAEILRGSPFAEGSDYGAVADVLRPVALELSLDQRIQQLLQLVQRAPGLPRAGGN